MIHRIKITNRQYHIAQSYTYSIYSPITIQSIIIIDFTAMHNQPNIEQAQPQQPFTNPDDYLSLGNQPQPQQQPQPQLDYHPQPQLDYHPQPSQILPNTHNKPSHELQSTLPAAENVAQKVSIPTEKKVTKHSKKIKKKQQSSEEGSFTEHKEGAKGGSEAKNRGRKPKSVSETVHNKIKPHKKPKIDQVQQIRRQVKELTNVKEPMPQQKPIQRQKIISRRTIPVIEQNKSDQPHFTLPWQHGKPKQQDLHSVEAELSEESMIRRNQSLTYRRLAELIAQQSDNLVQLISQLPPLLY